MPKLGLGSSLNRAGLVTPSIVTDSLVLKHNYAAGGVVPVSDGAAYFDASATDYIDLDAHVGDFSSLTTGTISVWFKTSTTSTYKEIFTASDKSDEASDVTLGIKSDNTVLFWQREASGTYYDIYSASTYTDGIWHHVAVTQDNTTMKMYVDGVLEADTDTGSKWFSDVNDLDTLRIGVREDSGGNEFPFDGYICNVGVWSAALTQAQIKSIMWKNYAGLTSSETTGLVSWWNLSANANDDHGSNDGTLT